MMTLSCGIDGTIGCFFPQSQNQLWEIGGFGAFCGLDSERIPENERDYYLGAPLESQTTGPQTTNFPLVENTWFLLDDDKTVA